MNREEGCTIIPCRTLCEQDHQVLSLLYGPLMGHEALALYETMLALGADEHLPHDHTPFILLGFSVDRVHQQRQILERFLLLRTYMDPKDQSYVYQLCPPMEGNAFLRHEVLGRLYLNQLGTKAYEAARLRFAQDARDTEKLVEISAVMDAAETFAGTQEEAFVQMRPQPSDQQLPFRFDVFLQGLERRFPARLQTPQNMRLIAELALAHGLSEVQMRRLVNQCINPRTGVFNTELLRKKVRGAHAVTSGEARNPYDMAPVLFFQQKQHGVEVSRSDRQLIESLMTRYHLPREVANVLIETVLEKTNQSFARNYVEKVASSWVRLGIDTLEKAQKQAAGEKQGRESGGASLPKWYEQSEERTDAQVDDEAIARMQKALRGE